MRTPGMEFLPLRRHAGGAASRVGRNLPYSIAFFYVIRKSSRLDCRNASGCGIMIPKIRDKEKK